ncbi:MAG TPA: hypothetical protein VN743_08730 [Blastocatellia bacterium]|nr:hypothetical protein [Blastocatellia bacterium]
MKRSIFITHAVLVALIALTSACASHEESSAPSNSNAQQANSNATPPADPQPSDARPNPSTTPPLTVQTLPPPPGKPTENVSKPDKAVSASNASGREPKLIAPEKRIDFGKQPQDKNLVRAIAIRNGGSADLKIESIVPS